MTKSNISKLMTPTSAGMALKLSAGRIRQLCDDGTLETVRLYNGTRLISPESVDAYAAVRRAANPETPT